MDGQIKLHITNPEVGNVTKLRLYENTNHWKRKFKLIKKYKNNVVLKHI